MTNEKKTEKTLVTGLNCFVNVADAYEDIKLNFEMYSGERIFKRSIKSETAKNELTKKIDDEEAEIYVVETNLIQRGFKDLKISEQAFAVGLWYNKLFDERNLKGINDELYLIENGKPMPKDKGEKITLPTATYKRYLSNYSKKEVNEIIEKALALYFEQGNE